MTFRPEDKLRPSFSYLIDKNGFKIGSSYDPGGYGEYSIVMTSEDFCIQLESDRGTNVSVLLSPPDQKEWHSLYYVQILITGKEPLSGQSLEERAQFIKSNYQRIKTMYGADRRQKSLQDLSGLVEAAGRKVAPEHYRELAEKRDSPSEMAECEWEEIHGFRGWPEFDKFTVWVDEQVKAGVAIEVPVEKLYSGSSIIEQKWLRHALSGQVWRLVWPDPPFEGVFEPVANENKRRD